MYIKKSREPAILTFLYTKCALLADVETAYGFSRNFVWTK